MAGSNTMRLCIRVPSPRVGWGGAEVTDADTGRELPVRSLDLHVDAKGMTPIIIMEIAQVGEPHELLLEGTYRFELVPSDEVDGR